MRETQIVGQAKVLELRRRGVEMAEALLELLQRELDVRQATVDRRGRQKPVPKALCEKFKLVMDQLRRDCPLDDAAQPAPRRATAEEEHPAPLDPLANLRIFG